jgi:hypothetical protein
MGQVMTGDFIIATTVFLLAIGLSVFMFNSSIKQIKNEQEEDFMHVTAVSVSELLIKTEGSPKNWNSSNVKSIGLASGDLLNQSKVIEFVNMSYDSVRNIMNIKQYGMKMTFNSINGSVLNISGTEMQIGSDPPNNSQVINIKRNTLITDGGERTIALMNFILWRQFL